MKVWNVECVHIERYIIYFVCCMFKICSFKYSLFRIAEVKVLASCYWCDFLCAKACIIGFYLIFFFFHWSVETDLCMFICVSIHLNCSFHNISAYKVNSFLFCYHRYLIFSEILFLVSLFYFCLPINGRTNIERYYFRLFSFRFFFCLSFVGCCLFASFYLMSGIYLFAFQ